MKQLKSKLGKLLSRIGNKLQDKPNLLLTPSIGPVIQYNTDEFELIQARYEVNNEALKNMIHNDDDFDYHIVTMLEADIAEKILETHRNDIETYVDSDYTTYSLRLLVSKSKNEIK